MLVINGLYNNKYMLSNQQNYIQLAEKIESGEYFQEAQDWYLRKYEINFIERTYLLVIILLMSFLFLLSYTYYQAIRPIKKSIPVQVNISSAADFNTRIKYLVCLKVMHYICKIKIIIHQKKKNNGKS